MKKPQTGYMVHHSTAASRYAGVLMLLIVAALVSMPWWASRGHLREVTEFMYLLALAQMWNLLAGYGGLVSIGQQAFVGVGGYSLVVFALHLGVNPFWAVPLAGLVALVFAVPTAAVVFRLRGAYFAVGTWVVAEVFRLVVANIYALGSGSGTSLTPALIPIARQTRELAIFWIALALGIGSVFAVYLLLRTRSGLALTALRDSERAAESVGVRVVRVKWMIYLASALGCGMTGALIYLTKLRIAPGAAFSVHWSVLMIFIVVIGGIGSIEGPIVGALVFFLLRHALSDYGSWYLILLGLFAISAMMVARKGIWGLVSQRLDLHLFPVLRRVQLINPGSDPPAPGSGTLPPGDEAGP